MNFRSNGSTTGIERSVQLQDRHERAKDVAERRDSLQSAHLVRQLPRPRMGQLHTRAPGVHGVQVQG